MDTAMAMVIFMVAVFLVFWWPLPWLMKKFLGFHLLEERHDTFEILFESDRWDGAAINGLGLYKGEEIWFKLSSDPYLDDDLLYDLYRLSPDELANYKKSIEKFRQMIGTHCDYINGKRNPNGQVSYTKESFEKFYTNHKSIVKPIVKIASDVMASGA